MKHSQRMLCRKRALLKPLAYVTLSLSAIFLHQTALAATDRVTLQGSSCIPVAPYEQKVPVIYDNWGIRANEAPTGISSNIYTQADVICPISVTAPAGRTYSSASLYMVGYLRNSADPGNDNLSCTLQATDAYGNNYQAVTARFTTVRTDPVSATAYLYPPAYTYMFYSVKCHLPKIPYAGAWSSHLTAIVLSFNY
jgi:hypothetical protein